MDERSCAAAQLESSEVNNHRQSEPVVELGTSVSGVSNDASALEQELEAVYTNLTDASDALASPLQQLVRSQIDQAEPYVRAAVVLAAGLGEPDTDSLRLKRIQLAAALEMLFVAHNIHGLLLAPHARSMDKSVMGSTILAGDYCFSHSATLAAGTDSPEVVAIFAQALKTVSEGTLRHLFGERGDYDENHDLFTAGVEAATMLAELSETEKTSILCLLRRTVGPFTAC